jgi:gliding motility-associated-like protein
LIAIGSGTFQWTPTTNLLNPTSATPLVFPKNTTYYAVTLTENGCTGTDSVKVNVINSVSLDAGPDSTICLTDPVTMRPVTNGLYFNWQPASIFANNTLRNAVATPVAAITRVQVTASVGKCRTTDSLILRTVPYPQVNAGNDSIICYADTVFLNGSTNGTAYAWSPTALVQNPAQLSTIGTLTQTTTFTLTATDNKGCPKPASDDVLIIVRPRVTVNAGNDTSVVYNQRLQFNATSTAGNFRWTPSTALSNPNISNPVAVYTAGTIADGTDVIRYTVTASTPEGCSATDDILVRVFKTLPTVFVPNAFTPNADGLNDVIRPVLAGIQRLEFFRIYNRYGELVFETRESGKGWDGRINGQLQGSNAYVYQVKALDYQGETIFNKGTFVLVR